MTTRIHVFKELETGNKQTISAYMEEQHVFIIIIQSIS